MPINLPESQKQVYDRVISDIQNELPESGPYLKNNFVSALAMGYSGRIYDNYWLLLELIKEMFPDTAEGSYLERWGSLLDVYRLPATVSSGQATFTGTIGNSVPLDSEFQSSDGIIYKVTEAVSVANISVTISSLTRTGSVVTAVTNADHDLATGMAVTISGAVETGYNGSYNIIATDYNEFTYTISTTPTTPATGSPVVGFTGGTLKLESETTGVLTNQDSGTELIAVSTLTGIDDTAYVQFGLISGGTDDEDDEAFRERVIYKYQNPIAPFNEANIIDTCKSVAGVTRVFVQKATPTAGQVTIYFVRDNDTSSIFPSSSAINTVKDKLLTIILAHMDEADMFVYAPTPLPVNFTFTSLSPNTVTMQQAIKDNLTYMFQESATVGSDLDEAAYLSAIYQTVDLTTGATVDLFSLSAPSGDITVADGELPVLGTVNFS